MSSEMLKMRQQLEYLQAELSLRSGGSSCAEVQVCLTIVSGFAWEIKKIVWYSSIFSGV